MRPFAKTGMQRYGFAWNEASRAYVAANQPSELQLAAHATRRGNIGLPEVLAAIDRDDLETVQFYNRALLGIDLNSFWRRMLRSDKVLGWMIEQHPTQDRLRDLCVRGHPLALRCAELVPPDWYTLFCTVHAGQLELLQKLPWRETDADLLCYAIECDQQDILEWLLDQESAISDKALLASRKSLALAQRLIQQFQVSDQRLARCKFLQAALQIHNRQLARYLADRVGELDRFEALDLVWYRIPQQRVYRLADRMKQDLAWWHSRD